MKKLAAVLSLLLLANVAHSAPYYTGVGCNEEGTRCTFGTPSKRVLNWSRKGTTKELGEKCEKFLQNIEDRKNEIAKSKNVVLKYKNFTYSWSRDLEENGQAKIVCNVEIHSELADVKVVPQTSKEFFWVCENEQSAGICRHYMSECEQARQEALKGVNVLDATIYMGGSLLQGVICTVATAKVQ